MPDKELVRRTRRVVSLAFSAVAYLKEHLELWDETDDREAVRIAVNECWEWVCVVDERLCALEAKEVDGDVDIQQEE